MAADVVSFLTVVAMGLFTVFAIIGGYLLLNTAVTNIARESAYYTFVRMGDLIANTMQSNSASATNMYLSPQYVIFSAYFSDEIQTSYYETENLGITDIVINTENNELLSQLMSSSTGQSSLNNEVSNRIELRNCVDDVCLCIGEVSSILKLEDDFIIPNACADICWGEKPGEYDTCLNDINNNFDTPKELFNYCNNQISNNNPGSLCNECVDYMNSDNWEIINEEYYNVLTLTNTDYTELEKFSEATKYSFIPLIIECKSMSEYASQAAKPVTCSGEPYLFNYLSEEGTSGVFSILSVEEDIIFKLFNMDYFYTGLITSPSDCYVQNSFINTELR